MPFPGERVLVEAGWCCLWASHPRDVPAVGVPCWQGGGHAELCDEVCEAKRKAAESRREAA